MASVGVLKKAGIFGPVWIGKINEVNDMIGDLKFDGDLGYGKVLFWFNEELVDVIGEFDYDCVPKGGLANRDNWPYTFKMDLTGKWIQPQTEFQMDVWGNNSLRKGGLIMIVGDIKTVRYRDQSQVHKCLYILVGPTRGWYIAEPFEDSLDSRDYLGNEYLRDYLGRIDDDNIYGNVFLDLDEWGNKHDCG